MKYRILASQLNKLMREASILSKNGGHEICGLLIDNGYFIELVRLKNKKKKGGSYSFYLKEADYIEKACNRMNHQIIGTFHSHPFDIAKPGESDKAGAFRNELMLIIDVLGKSAKLWQITNMKGKEIPFDLI